MYGKSQIKYHNPSNILIFYNFIPLWKSMTLFFFFVYHRCNDTIFLFLSYYILILKLYSIYVAVIIIKIIIIAIVKTSIALTLCLK